MSVEAIDEQAALGRSEPLRPGSRPRMVVRLCEGCGRDVKHVRVRAEDGVAGAAAPDPDATGTTSNSGEKARAAEPFGGRGDVVMAFVALPRTDAPSGELVVELEGWDGRRHEARWPLADASAS